MKKTNKKKQITRKHSPNAYSNDMSKSAYNLEDYRNKKRNYYNPYAINEESPSPKETNRQNPYRNYYGSGEGTRATSNQQTNKQVRKTSTSRNYDTTYNGYEEYTSATNRMPRNDYAKTPEERKMELREKNKMTRKQAMQQSKRRKKLMIKKVLVVMSIGVFVSYAGIKAIDLFTYPSVSYQTVQQGMIDNSKLISGIIFRNEKVVKSNRTGDIHYITGEGQKVAQKGNVCMIGEQKQFEDLASKLYNVEEDLYNKQEKRNDLSYYQGEVKQVNESLQKEFDQFFNSKYWESPKSVYLLRQVLDKNIQERTNFYIKDDTKVTEELKVERDELITHLNNTQGVEKATQTGVVSYTLDQYEEVLKLESISQFSYDQYKKLSGQIKDASTMIPPSRVEADQPLYKIVMDDVWKVVTYIDTEEAQQYEIGKSYKLYFNEVVNEKGINFKLEEKTTEGKVDKLVFASNDYLVDFLPYREVAFTIGKNKAEGLKIPLKAIVEKNMIAIPNDYLVEEGHEKGVLIKQEAGNRFVPVLVQYSDENFTYIMQQIDNLKGVSIGTVIENPEGKEPYTLSELQTVQGVYVVNGQFAQFKRIDIALINNEYAILKTTKDNKLKEFDQIISNPKNIKEDQLLKYMNVQNE